MRLQKRTNIVVLFGMPGVGKLTVARALAASTGYSIFHNHLIVDALTAIFPFGTKPFVDLRETFWLDVMTRAAREGTDGLIFTFAPEPSVKRGFLDRLAAAIAGAGGDSSFIQLTCTAAEHDQRVTNPSRATFGKLTDLAAIRRGRRDGSFGTDLKADIDLRLDITELSPDDAAQEISDGLQLQR
jgi:hypothetical protein